MVHKWAKADDEAVTGWELDISCPVGSDDHRLFVGVVNQGIDSHLDGFTPDKLRHIQAGGRLKLTFCGDGVRILVRRLEELETEEADRWADDIRDSMANRLIDLDLAAGRDPEGAMMARDIRDDMAARGAAANGRT